MPLLRVSRARPGQPAPPAAIADGPFKAFLSEVYVASGMGYESVSTRRSTVTHTGAAGYVVGQDGSAFGSVVSGQTSISAVGNWGSPDTQKGTLFLRARLNSVGTWGTIFQKRNASTYRILIQRSSTSNTFVFNLTAGTATFNTCSIASLLDGNYHTFIWTLENVGAALTKATMYVDGVKHAGSSNISSWIPTDMNGATVIGTDDGTYSSSVDASIVGYYNGRVFSSAEACAFDPWRLFAPQRIWVPVSAGGVDFTFSGSGGLQLGGSASAASTAQFVAIGSGGLQLGGSAAGTFTNAFAVTGSGGFAFAGAAASAFTGNYSFSASGGVQFSGAATASSGSDYAVSGSGGLLLGGSASAVNSSNFVASAAGGIVFAGAAGAVSDSGFDFSASGGVVFAGAATTATTPAFQFLGGGGLQFGGNASETYSTDYSFTTSGGLVLAGAATASMTETGSGTGATVDEIWNGILLEASMSPADMLRIILAAVSGRTTGIGTDNERYLSVDGSKARVAATFDASGNRQAVTLDGSA